MYFCLSTFCDVLRYVHFCVTSCSAEHRQLHCWGWPQCEFRALSVPCPNALLSVDILWCPMLRSLLCNLIFSRASSIALLKMDKRWVPCHNRSFYPLPKWLLFVDILWCPMLCSLLCLLIFRPHDRQSHCWVWIKGEFRVIIVIPAPCPICTCLDAHFKCPVRWALFETLVFCQTTSVPSPRLVIWSFSCFNRYSCSLLKWHSTFSVCSLVVLVLAY